MIRICLEIGISGLKQSCEERGKARSLEINAMLYALCPMP